MKIFRLIIVSITYLLIGVLEVYSYYLFKADGIGGLAFFTLAGFIVTFALVLGNDSIYGS